VTRQAALATPISSAAIHPMTFSGKEIVNGPMMSASAAISMSSAITGTATTPLITAAQRSAERATF
jgi:hypothetical protein